MPVELLSDCGTETGFMCNSISSLYISELCKKVECGEFAAWDPTYGVKNKIQLQILRLNATLKVGWLKQHLAEYILRKADRSEPSIFYSWTPGIFMAKNSGRFTRVMLPSCPLVQQVSHSGQSNKWLTAIWACPLNFSNKTCARVSLGRGCTACGQKKRAHATHTNNSAHPYSS